MEDNSLVVDATEKASGGKASRRQCSVQVSFGFGLAREPLGESSKANLLGMARNLLKLRRNANTKRVDLS